MDKVKVLRQDTVTTLRITLQLDGASAAQATSLQGNACLSKPDYWFLMKSVLDAVICAWQSTIFFTS